MPLRADIQTSAGDGGGGVAELAQRKAVQNLELLARGHDVELAGGRDAEEASIHPDGGAEEVAADAFLEADFAGGRMEAGDDAAIAPQPSQVAERDAGGDVGGGLFHLVGQLGLPSAGGVARFDGDEAIAAATAAAGAE